MRPRCSMVKTENGKLPARSSYVQKIRVPARVSQPSMDPRDGWFLLYPAVGNSDRPETLLELLNSARTVIPFIQAENATVLLLTRVNIDWIVVGREVDSGLVFPPSYRVTVEQHVDLRLIDESKVRAVLQWNAARGVDRLSDYLNSSESFIPARTGFGTLLMNKLRVRETLVAESTPRPLVAKADASPHPAAHVRKPADPQGS